MGFSALANMAVRIPDGGRSTPRNTSVTGMGLHHNAGVDSFGEASNPRREVSANYWIANDGTIIPNIDETRRAFTSGASGYPAGAAADHRNITVEISNSPEGVRSGSWAVSEAAWKSLVALVADVWKRYGLGVVTRNASRGLGVHQDWVPTSCPGPYIMNNLGGLISQANDINAGRSAPHVKAKEEDMLTFIASHPNGTWYVTDGLTKRPIAPNENQLLVDLGQAKYVDKPGRVNLVSPVQLARIPDQNSALPLDTAGIVAEVVEAIKATGVAVDVDYEKAADVLLDRAAERLKQ